MTDPRGVADDGGEAPCLAPLFDAGAPTDADLAAVVRGLSDAVVVADADGTITFWNDAAERLFGWPAPEALGQSLDLIIPERLRDRHWAGYRQVMGGGPGRHGAELLQVPALHRDGSQRSVAFTVTLLRRGGDVRPVAIAAVLRDQTEQWQERRRLEARLAELEADP
jgi:PAS domain S-box-containing protein